MTETPQLPSSHTGQSQWRPILLIAGGLFVTAALIMTAVLVWAPSVPEDEAGSSPGTSGSTSIPDDELSSDTGKNEPHTDDTYERPTYGPDAPEIAGSGTVAERIQAFEDHYTQLYESGALWESIPETKENTGAYLAFQFILADMRSATRFNVDDETQAQYLKHAKHVEERFLAQEPLGPSVKYTLQDDRIFTYNGKTGEVWLE